MVKEMMALSWEDRDLFDLNWCHSGGYWKRYVSGGRKVKVHEQLHRVVLSRMLGRALVKGEWVDHINERPWDCRRSNLRLATQSQNQANTANLRRNNTSGFRGVLWDKRRSKWRAEIRIDGRCRHLGYFDIAQEASDCYNRVAEETWPGFYHIPAGIVQSGSGAGTPAMRVCNTPAPSSSIGGVL